MSLCLLLHSVGTSKQYVICIEPSESLIHDELINNNQLKSWFIENILYEWLFKYIILEIYIKYLNFQVFYKYRF